MSFENVIYRSIYHCIIIYKCNVAIIDARIQYIIEMKRIIQRASAAKFICSEYGFQIYSLFVRMSRPYNITCWKCVYKSWFRCHVNKYDII